MPLSKVPHYYLGQCEPNKLIFGYVRRWCKKIPIVIKNICFKFYFLNEYFALHGSSVCMANSINTKIHTITNKKKFPLPNTIYGNVIIDVDDTSFEEYNWYFKITEMTQHDAFIIGLDSYENRLNKKFIDSNYACTSSNKLPLFAFGSNGKLYCHNKTKDCNRSNYDNPKKWKKKDEIEIRLSMANETVELFLNDKSCEIIYNIDLSKNQKYCIAIAVSFGFSCIELVGFEAKQGYKQ